MADVKKKRVVCSRCKGRGFVVESFAGLYCFPDSCYTCHGKGYVEKDNNRIQCAFCSWSTVRFYTNKKGKAVSGYRNLRDHVEICHPEEFKKLEKELEEDAYFETWQSL